ncbi:MAG: alpha/beta fold hydrolase [Chloroflexota bacterium]
MTTLGVKFQSHGSSLVGRMWLTQGEGERPTVLLLHGLPGIDQNHDLAYALRDAGWNSLLMHYRGCWGSEGNYSLHNILPDIDVMLDFLLNDEDVDNNKIVVCGHSLGGWAAAMTGARRPEVAGVVSLAGVGDWKQMDLTEEGAEAGMTRFLTNVSAETLIRETQELDSAVEAVEKLNGRPLLIIHGDSDAAVDISHSHALQKRYPTHTTLHTVADADHGFAWERDEMIGAVIEWLGKI